MIVIEAVFISEQIKKYRFGALIELRDKFITKLNVFRYINIAIPA